MPETITYKASSRTGLLIVNADDWGQDVLTTGRILQSCLRGAVTSVSAMMFMEDSERSAKLALENGIDVGLHVNVTSYFTARSCPAKLREQLQRTARFLGRNRFSRVLFHPGLRNSFEYLVLSQIDEFQRIYGKAPDRYDGHHHMHLCGNVMFQQLLPAGSIVRRNFSFRRGEKGFLNRLYRAAVDRRLSSRHRMTDFLFNLRPMESRERLHGIYSLAKESVVELETHPIRLEEFEYLSGDGFLRDIGGVRIASAAVAFQNRQSGGGQHYARL